MANSLTACGMKVLVTIGGSQTLMDVSSSVTVGDLKGILVTRGLGFGDEACIRGGNYYGDSATLQEVCSAKSKRAQGPIGGTRSGSVGATGPSTLSTQEAPSQPANVVEVAGAGGAGVGGGGPVALWFRKESGTMCGKASQMEYIVKDFLRGHIRAPEARGAYNNQHYDGEQPIRASGVYRIPPAPVIPLQDKVGGSHTTSTTSSTSSSTSTSASTSTSTSTETTDKNKHGEGEDDGGKEERKEAGREGEEGGGGEEGMPAWMTATSAGLMAAASGVGPLPEYQQTNSNSNPADSSSSSSSSSSKNASSAKNGAPTAEEPGEIPPEVVASGAALEYMYVCQFCNSGFVHYRFAEEHLLTSHPMHLSLAITAGLSELFKRQFYDSYRSQPKHKNAITKNKFRCGLCPYWDHFSYNNTKGWEDHVNMYHTTVLATFCSKALRKVQSMKRTFLLGLRPPTHASSSSSSSSSSLLASSSSLSSSSVVEPQSSIEQQQQQHHHHHDPSRGDASPTKTTTTKIIKKRVLVKRKSGKGSSKKGSKKSKDKEKEGENGDGTALKRVIGTRQAVLREKEKAAGKPAESGGQEEEGKPAKSSKKKVIVIRRKKSGASLKGSNKGKSTTTSSTSTGPSSSAAAQISVLSPSAAIAAATATTIPVDPNHPLYILGSSPIFDKAVLNHVFDFLYSGEEGGLEPNPNPFVLPPDWNPHHHHQMGGYPYVNDSYYTRI